MRTRDMAGPQGRLVCEEAGPDGPLPVILVHSDSGSRGHWRHALPHLASSRRAVGLDLRGHGDSAPPRDGDLSYKGRADDVLACADQLGLGRFVVVGHSGGAAAALALAVENPERVAGLLLVDPVTDPASIPADQRAGALSAIAGPDYLAVVTGYYRSILGPNKDTAEIVLQDVARTPQETILGAMKALDALRPRGLLDRYDGPTLSIVLPVNDTEHALHRMGGGFPARHFPTLDVGHWFHLDDPPTFHAMLDAFLGEVDRRG